MLKKFFSLLIALAVTSPVYAQGNGQYGKVIRIERSAFSPDAGKITFSEKPLRSRNPTYEASHYGGKLGLTLYFGGYFKGQYVASSQCGRGAAPGGCIAGRPSAPLALDPRAPMTSIQNDGSNPNSPSLSGTPIFNGPVTILFSREIAGVGLAGGYFDALGGTSIRAYDKHGNEIGGVRNSGLGMEFMALVTEDGSDRIMGLQFSLVGPEPKGFAIDDLSFAFSSQIRRDQVGGIKDILGAKTPTVAEQKTPKGSLADLFEDITPSEAPAAKIETPTRVAPGKNSLSCLFDTAECAD